MTRGKRAGRARCAYTRSRALRYIIVGARWAANADVCRCDGESAQVFIPVGGGTVCGRVSGWCARRRGKCVVRRACGGMEGGKTASRAARGYDAERRRGVVGADYRLPSHMLIQPCAPPSTLSSRKGLAMNSLGYQHQRLCPFLFSAHYIVFSAAAAAYDDIYAPSDFRRPSAWLRLLLIRGTG